MVFFKTPVIKTYYRPTDRNNQVANDYTENKEAGLCSEKIRALGLCSGGLDSILSALVLRDQGIEVEWIAFETPFFKSDKARNAARMTGIPLTVQNITPIFLKMLKNPNCGYGKHMNPCLDCHALMFRLAGELMRKKGFHFLFSGEVMGQRPMSQTRSSLRYVEKHSGMEGYILRPLSAKKLDETFMEKQNWINRHCLLDISGRSRKPQIEMAKQYGIKDYPASSGGCLLTDKIYCIRLKDLFDHQQNIRERDLELLRFGRHFRSKNNTKLIVGRTQKDNENILNYYDSDKDIKVQVTSYPGPVLIISDSPKSGDIQLAAAICAGYSKAPPDKSAEVLAITPDRREMIKVLPIAPSVVKHLLI
jgi:tRNA U34 2-thiouridine synthase MnmA/TrmU